MVWNNWFAFHISVNKLSCQSKTKLFSFKSFQTSLIRNLCIRLVRALHEFKTMSSFLVVISKLFVWFYPKLEIIFGLSNVGQQNGNFYKLISFAMKAFFVGFYPIACSRYLSFFTKRDTRATTYARNLTFAFNWVLLSSIYLNELSFRGLAKLMNLINHLIEKQTPKENFIFLLRCTLKMTILGGVLITLNFNKYMVRKNKNLKPWDECMMFFLLLPFFVMILAANRINIGNTIVKQFLVCYRNETVDSKTVGDQYGRLHDFFVAFNKSNSMNFLTILGFCILNIVYEVITCSWFC